MRKFITRITFLFIITLVGVLGYVLVTLASTAGWSTLNQLIDLRMAEEKRGSVFYRFSLGIVQYTGQVEVAYCNREYDGHINAVVDVYQGFPASPGDGTYPGWPQSWSFYNEYLLTSHGGSQNRIFNGDSTAPKLILLDVCFVQVIDNNGLKKNLWVDVLPSILVHPYP